MRTRLILIPIVILAVTAGGTVFCIAAGVNPHWREMLCAACGSLIASGLAVIPLLLARGATQPGVANAGLVGTLIHLLGFASFGAAVIIFKIGRLDASVTYWLLAMYWATLIALVVCLVSAVKSAPIEAGIKRT